MSVDIIKKMLVTALIEPDGKPPYTIQFYAHEIEQWLDMTGEEIDEAMRTPAGLLAMQDRQRHMIKIEGRAPVVVLPKRASA